MVMVGRQLECADPLKLLVLALGPPSDTCERRCSGGNCQGCYMADRRGVVHEPPAALYGWAVEGRLCWGQACHTSAVGTESGWLGCITPTGCV